MDRVYFTPYLSYFPSATYTPLSSVCRLLEVTEKCERFKKLMRKRTVSEAERYVDTSPHLVGSHLLGETPLESSEMS